MIFWKLTHKKLTLSVVLLLTVCALFLGCDGLGNDPTATTPPAETTAPVAGLHQLNLTEDGPLYLQIGDTLTLDTDAPAYDVDVLLLYDKTDSPAAVAAKVAKIRESGLTVSAQCAIPERIRYAELRRMKD